MVTSAGLVFAATMAAMLGSKLIVLAQMGSTIAIPADAVDRLRP